MSLSIHSSNERDQFNIYSRLSSGKRINRAADDAAGLSAAQKLLKQENGMNAGAQNTRDGIGVLNTADGAMGGIMDYLQRIDELSIRSMNGLYSDSDRQAIQSEINGMLDGIQSLAKGTSLNQQKLLDGSMADLHLATDPSGGGLDIRMENTTLKALGLAGYNVTGSFDLGAVENAMNIVSRARGRMGASVNRLEHTYNYNMQASENLVGSRSRIEDLDMPKAVSEKQKQDLLAQYRNLMLRRKMQDDSMVTRLFQH